MTTHRVDLEISASARTAEGRLRSNCATRYKEGGWCAAGPLGAPARRFGFPPAATAKPRLKRPPLIATDGQITRELDRSRNRTTPSRTPPACAVRGSRWCYTTPENPTDSTSDREAVFAGTCCCHSRTDISAIRLPADKAIVGYRRLCLRPPPGSSRFTRNAEEVPRPTADPLRDMAHPDHDARLLMWRCDQFARAAERGRRRGSKRGTSEI